MSSLLLLSSSGKARRVAAGGLVLAATIALCAAVACSFLVNDSLPEGYACVRDAGTVCPPNQTCAPSGGPTDTCVNTCVMGVKGDCLPGDTCDPQGWCVPGDGGGVTDTATTSPDSDGGGSGDAAPADAGSPCSSIGCRCTTTANCPAGLSCVDQTAVTSDIWNAWIDSGIGAGDGTGSGLCVQPCCTSTDCAGDGGAGGGYVCFATGAGGNYCVAPEWLSDRSTIGGSGGGMTCTDGGDCRSGLCQAGICVDTCCSSHSQSYECALNSICRFSAFPGGSTFDTHYTARCMPITGGNQGTTGGNSCGSNSECRSNLCVTGAGTSSCRDACRNSLDCVVGTTATRSTTFTCQYNQPQAAGADIIASCAPVNNGGGGGGFSAPTDAGICFMKADCQVTGGAYCEATATRIGMTPYSVLTCGP